MCVTGASVKSSRALKNTGLRHAYQHLGSKLVTDHIQMRSYYLDFSGVLYEL